MVGLLRCSLVGGAEAAAVGVDGCVYHEVGVPVQREAVAVEGCGVLVEEVGKGANAVVVDFVVLIANADEVSEFDCFGAKLDRGE